MEQSYSRRASRFVIDGGRMSIASERTTTGSAHRASAPSTLRSSTSKVGKSRFSERNREAR